MNLETLVKLCNEPMPPMLPAPEPAKQIRITIGVGCGLRKDKSPISPADCTLMIGRAKRWLLDTCGGYTMTRADGGWRDDSGVVWEEPSLGFVAIVESGEVDVESLARGVRDIFEQVCVMVTVEPVYTKLI